MANVIFIHKAAGARKDAVRVTTAKDIPDFLRNTITVQGNEVVLDCVEGVEIAPLGSVIGYEKSDNTSSGWNCWVIGNADTNLVERDGVFYKKATIMKAQKVTEDYPDFLRGANIIRYADGAWGIKTDWGTSKGYPKKAYWVLYGMKADGTPDANILTKTEKAYHEYILCTEDGLDIGNLAELDPA